MSEFDPIALEILWGRLISIADEAAAALVRTAFSTIVRESNDYACVLLDTEGNALAENRGSIPSFVGCLSRTMKSLLGLFPLSTWRTGDAVLTNDPWLGTGHKPDMTLVMPMFVRGSLVGFAGSIAHSPDIGGIGWSADAREVFEEGLTIPPVKLLKSGEANRELIELIRANVRQPDEVIGDLYAQVSAGTLCGQRLTELLEEEGLGELAELGKTIQSRAEEAMRRAIRGIADGRYEGRAETDGFDSPLVIRCSVTVNGDGLSVDYTGTSPQIDRGLNCVMNYTWAYTAYPIKCALDPITPQNEGSYRPIQVSAPVGSLLNPRFPAPVNARQLTGHCLAAALYDALAKVAPDRVIAEAGSAPALRVAFRGRGASGRPFGLVFFANGGMGARPSADGLACTPFPTNSVCSAVEIMEGIAPLRVWRKELRADSGGAGQFRGGQGQEVVIEVLGHEPIGVALFADRVTHPARGMAGGLPGSPAEILLNGSATLHPKSRAILVPGDRLTVRYPGGGGYGDPRKRDGDAIRRDLAASMVSFSAAEALYGWRATSG